MISDEMVETAKQFLPAEVAGNIYSALDAVYPLIRAQVLEDVAAFIEEAVVLMDIVPHGTKREYGARMALALAQAIRGMIKP